MSDTYLPVYQLSEVTTPSKNDFIVMQSSAENGDVGLLEIENFQSTFIQDVIDNQIGYVTPQMFGAVGDGVADDTVALQTALDSTKMVVIPNGTYNISVPLEITHDVRVVCDTNVQIKPVANMTALLKVGVTVDGYTNPVFGGLVKVLWNGGTLWGYNGSYAVTDVIYTEKTYHCNFVNVTVANVSTNGVHIGGTVGAYCYFDNCVVRGKNGNGVRGFLIERSDQTITRCSVVDCIHGFEVNASNVIFDKCTAWMATDTDWSNTICFYIGGSYNKLTNCIIDTMFYGIRFKSGFKYGSASNLSWINNYDVVSNTTNMSLLSTDVPSSASTVSFMIDGLMVGALNNTALLKRDLWPAYLTTISNVSARNPSMITDLKRACAAIETRNYSSYGSGTNKLMKTDYGLRYVHDSTLSAVPGGTVINLAPDWSFTAISGALPVNVINNNSGALLTNVALYCNSGNLQFVLQGSTAYNLRIHVDIDIPQYSI